MVLPTFRGILLIMFFLCETIVSKSASKQLQIESYRISMRKLRTFYGKVTEFLKKDKSAAFGTSTHYEPFHPKYRRIICILSCCRTWIFIQKWMFTDVIGKKSSVRMDFSFSEWKIPVLTFYKPVQGQIYTIFSYDFSVKQYSNNTISTLLKFCLGI